MIEIQNCRPERIDRHPFAKRILSTSGCILGAVTHPSTNRSWPCLTSVINKIWCTEVDIIYYISYIIYFSSFYKWFLEMWRFFGSPFLADFWTSDDPYTPWTPNIILFEALNVILDHLGGFGMVFRFLKSESFWKRSYTPKSVAFGRIRGFSKRLIFLNSVLDTQNDLKPTIIQYNICCTGEQENISMFSMCSELTPRAPIPDSRIAQFMQPCLYIYLGLHLFHLDWDWESFKISSCPLSSIHTCKTNRRKPEKSDWKKRRTGESVQWDTRYKRDSRNGEDRKDRKG